MNDLIYANGLAKKDVLARFPEAVIEDASDFIHLERFSITLPDTITEEEYIKAVITLGLGSVSLKVQLMLRESAEEFDKIKKWAGEIK